MVAQKWSPHKAFFFLTLQKMPKNIKMNQRIPPVQSSSSWKPERGPTWPDSNPSFEAIGTPPFDTDKAA